MSSLGKTTSDVYDKLMKTGEYFLVDCIDGCLIDNYLLCTESCLVYLFLKEVPLNTWTSGYEIFMGSELEITEKWEEFRRNFEEVVTE